jgi:hypothetical protein
VFPADPKAITAHAGALFLNDRTLAVPPHSESTATSRCMITGEGNEARELKIIGITGHYYFRGKQFDAYRANADGFRGELLYEDRDFDQPAFQQYSDNPIVRHKGEGREWQCKYQNNTNTTFSSARRGPGALNPLWLLLPDRHDAGSHHVPARQGRRRSRCHVTPHRSLSLPALPAVAASFRRWCGWGNGGTSAARSLGSRWPWRSSRAPGSCTRGARPRPLARGDTRGAPPAARGLARLRLLLRAGRLPHHAARPMSARPLPRRTAQTLRRRPLQHLKLAV